MPAPRGTRAPPRRVAKPPEKQPRWLVWLAYIGIPLAVVAFIIGCGGVAVLMDEPERANWYSNTRFADVWRTLTEKNPFYMTLFVNGGMISTLFLGTKLYEHRRALKAERQLQKKVKVKKDE